MNPNIEQILLAQAANEASQAPSLGGSIAVGAGGGAALGALLGTPAHLVGKGIGNMRGTNKALKPGVRMAGGLVGMILGGALGASARNEAINSPGGAGSLLAKIQSQGGMTSQDEQALELILRDAYSQQGIVG